MIKIKTNDLIGLVLLITFFAWQIFSGVIQYAFLAALIVLGILYIFYRKGNIYVLWFFALLLQKALQRVTNSVIYQAITYIDEITEIIAAIFIIAAIVRKKMVLSKIEMAIGSLFLIYFGFCFISTVVYSYQSPFISLLDCFVCLKFIIFYFAGKCLITTETFTPEKIFRLFNEPCRHMAVLLLLLSLHDLVLTPFFPKFDFRYFTYSLELCFQHPAWLAIVCITCIIILAYNMRYSRKNMRYILMLAAVTLLTFRSKEMAAVAIIVFLYFLFIKFRFKGNTLTLIPLGAAASYFASDQFEKYFTVHDYAPLRLKLIQDGIKIANEHFPFGAGFATFGTTVSYEYMSSFYYKYGYFTEEYINQQIIADAFWHGIFAEAGWFGSVAFILAIILMVADSLIKMKTCPYAGWCMISIMIYGLISSIASSSFFNPSIALMFIFYGIASAENPNSVKKQLQPLN